MADRVILLDCEASGLHCGSYPTEVAWVTHDLLDGGSYLVRPPVHWLASPWSAEAEAVTGISQPMLGCHGLPPAEVSARLNEQLADQVPLTDSPGHDGLWLRILYAEAGVVPSWTLPRDGIPCDVGVLITPAAAEAGLTAAQVEAETARLSAAAGLQAHRALDDAIQHALTLGAVVQWGQHGVRDAAGYEVWVAELVRRAVVLKARVGRVGEARGA